MAAITTAAISKCVGVTTTGTYTCVITGPNLIVGTPIIIAGFVANTTFNETKIIVTVVGNPTTSFTCTITSTTATETISATGTYDPEGAQSYPTADTSNPWGFGVMREGNSQPLGSGVQNYYPYGDYIPGTIIGGSQPIIDF